VNPEFLVEAHQNKLFQTLLKNTFNICDGAGIQFLGKLFYRQNIPRITGVALAELLCKICEQEERSIFFLGGFGVAQKAAKVVQIQFPKLKITGAIDGHPDKLATEITESKPDVILVAFGAPKQEYWLQKFGSQIPGLKIGVGIGGTFDFWTKKTHRAPQWMQKIGLEWVWRLIQEPKRVKRIFNAVCVFPWLVIREKIK
jgi:N-acetylglucosaminyldiphosphoundecaprenol N-acetyl-beta-D-mannosaminyltransferase